MLAPSSTLSSKALTDSLRALLPSFDLPRDKVDRRLIPKCAQSSNDSNRLIAQEALMSELLPRMHVTDVALHKRNTHSD